LPGCIIQANSATEFAVLFTTKTGIAVHVLAQGPAKRW
jgi:hypothetical protein